MTARDQILDCVQRMFLHRDFTPQEILDFLRAAGTEYSDSTIRTHVTSRMCFEAPKNHEPKYDDLTRVSHGVYRLR
jgi:hypothetical protein